MYGDRLSGRMVEVDPQRIKGGMATVWEFARMVGTSITVQGWTHVVQLYIDHLTVEDETALRQLIKEYEEDRIHGHQ